MTSIVRNTTGAIGRILRAAGREVAEAIRWGAPRVAVAQIMNTGQSASNVPASIGGAIAIGEGRRLGAEANEGAITERQPD